MKCHKCKKPWTSQKRKFQQVPILNTINKQELRKVFLCLDCFRNREGKPMWETVPTSLAESLSLNK